jgi:uncharacterized cofD-like protein
MNNQISENVVVVGGGSGTYTLISALRRAMEDGALTSIHTTADSGGSSRKLMDEYGLPLPMGDLRQGLVAQSRKRRLWRDLFAYRFPPSVVGGGLSGHSLGNLILRALEELNNGSLMEALVDAEEILNTVGHVVPVTLQQTTLHAELADGQIVRGEDRIDQPDSTSRAPIARIYLDPVPEVTIRARKALARAERIILGPGDLYTSILPNLLVRGVPEAIAEGDAEIIYIVNLMTKPGETDNYKASDFIGAVTQYLGQPPDTVLINVAEFEPERLSQYADAGARPVQPDIETVQGQVRRVITDHFSSEQHYIRHDARKVLAKLWPQVV